MATSGESTNLLEQPLAQELQKPANSEQPEAKALDSRLGHGDRPLAGAARADPPGNSGPDRKRTMKAVPNVNNVIPISTRFFRVLQSP